MIGFMPFSRVLVYNEEGGYITLSVIFKVKIHESNEDTESFNLEV